ncbi:hypothetical protein LZ575_06880 [Antarcticibacterium sp. 1MA-6-2]|uniref:hypothetical protein n=1 Tax=Antarcticibacterium sp. 1MA-6-2 TaxID=2908210 RepID=UPI001F366E06|nr:hypothetical protein [Antarcticibacterium sp. 1MA-6-2]UJH92270.1 hypothetical protein LZ575_06880 [Antarcticibacterium sp. 1MA-6-2]
MKFSLYFLLILFTISGYSQDTLHRHYILLEQYVKLGNNLTKQDSLNFQFKGEDTLVLVSPDFLERNNNGIRVEYEPKDSLFLEIYKDVVYGKMNSEQREKETMKYWKDEIKIFFASGVPQDHSQKLMEFAKEISSEIDSLKITKVDNKEQSNFMIYYLNREYNIDYEPRINNRNGGYYINWNAKQQIYKGYVKINTEFVKNENDQVQLLFFHFFKSLGYFKSSEKLNCESYLSACRVPRRLTQSDREILKYHYSYGICKGVILKTFNELHESMQKTLRHNPKAQLYVVHSE